MPWTRLNRHYQPAVELARLVLTGAEADLHTGHVRAPGLVLNMATVFERFVRNTTRRALGVSERVFPSGSSAQLHLDDARQLAVEPDLSRWVEGRCRFVGELKYRYDKGKGDAPNLYQTLAHATAAGLSEATLVYAEGPSTGTIHPPAARWRAHPRPAPRPQLRARRPPAPGPLPRRSHRGVPAMTAGLNENTIRDLLLFVLNAQFEGQATGETFNGSGKTDILIRVNDRNVFIAECKIIDPRHKQSTDTVVRKALDEQLLQYLVWRDTKAALVLFIRDPRATAVIDQAVATIEKHPNYKRRGVHTDEERHDFVLHANGDQDREIQLALLPFVVRGPEDSQPTE